MRKLLVILIMLISAMLMMLTVLSGCRNDDTDTPENNNTDNNTDSNIAAGQLSEYAYIPQYITLPGDKGTIRNLAYCDGKGYFTARDYDYYATPKSREDMLSYTASELYSINLDGTELTQLPDYTPVSTLPYDAGGSTTIEKLTIDSDGNLWIIESVYFFTLDLPEDFNFENHLVQPEQHITLEAGTFIRKLDASGAEISSFDITELSMNKDMTSHFIRAFTVCGNYIYLLDTNGETWDTRTIHVLDTSGSIQFSLNTGAFFERFVHLPDDVVAFLSIGNTLQTIDAANGSLGEMLTMPGNEFSFSDYFTGGGDIDILVNTRTDVYGYTLSSNEEQPMFGWYEVDVNVDYVEDIIMTPEKNILCMSVNREKGISEIIMLERKHRSELEELAFLTLAGIYVRDEILEAVTVFNRLSPNCKLEIVDYSSYIPAGSYNDWGPAFERLALDITTGNAPDLLMTAGMPYRDYADSGFLADLYDFIDADPDFERGDFIAAVLKAFELGGGLYSMSPQFFVDTAVGSPTAVGQGTGWNVGEFMAVIDAHPDADIPFGGYRTNSVFLIDLLFYGLYDYVDFKTGEVFFDSPEFIRLLEFANSLPDTYIEISEREAITAGRQLLYPTMIQDFYFMQYYKQLFDGDFVFKGYPTHDKYAGTISSYMTVAIIENSPNKQAAWEFMKTFLDAQWQLDNVRSGLPTNQAAFDYIVKDVLETDVEGMTFNELLSSKYGYGSSIDFELVNPTREDIDMIIELINSSTGAQVSRTTEAPVPIITESAADYFRGAGSAADAAKTIQSRVSMWLSERM